MADAITPFTPDAEIDRLYGPGAAKQYRQKLLEKQQAYEADSGALDEALATPINQRQFREELMQQAQGEGEDLVPMPQGRGRGGVRGRYESPLDFEARMNREGGPSRVRDKGGLDAMYLMNNRGRTAEEAGTQAEIIRSQGGRVNADGTMSKAGVRPAPRSSTGRDYDPVAERKNMLSDAALAVRAKKQEQAGQQFDDLARMSRAQQVGSTRSFANKYGSGQGTTVLKDAPRPEATVTLGRNNPFTLPMREEIGFMENDMKAEAEFLKQNIKPKMKGGEVSPDISTMITGEDGPELQFKRSDGSLFVIPADITAKITAGLEMEDSEDGRESLNAIKGGKVSPRMGGGGFGQPQMNKEWVKEYRNTLTGMRGGTPMPGINAGMSPYAATLTAVRGGIPMPGVR
jgi:hypothetical protein